jgi:hypothetical protein
MIKPKLSYANIAATLALFFAMTGGALAAHHYLITSTKQISPKVISALKGKTGKTGPAGPQGLPGKEGAAGKEGKEGAAGKEGKEGKEGKQGEPGPLLAALPSGKTLKGHYHVEFGGTGTTILGEGYDYAFPLPSTPNGHFIANGTTPPAQCPGTVSDPKALPGNLCVYEGPNHSNDNVSIGSESDQFGFGLFVTANASGGFWSIGSWAVTAA